AAFITLPGLGLEPDLIEHDLKLIGGRYRRVQVPPYTLFVDFKPPDEGVPLDPAGWGVRASHNGESARNAIDGDIFSRWGTGTAQRPGQWFEVDLGTRVPVTRVGMALGQFGSDLPRGIAVLGSLDGTIWTELARADRHLGGLVWGEFHPVFDVTGRFELALPDRPVRFLRLVQTGTADPFDWSISELFVYGRGPAAPGWPGWPSWDDSQRELGRRLFRDALEALEEGKEDAALVSLDRAVRADPGHASAWQRLANVAGRRGIADAGALRLELARVNRERGLVSEADALPASRGKKAGPARP
ncbi:MAG: discoidin domain-containing protein, partial [Nitrospirae bacterium]|nr:discoidin domain-containing protein [Nitrospirota bacterium]